MISVLDIIKGLPICISLRIIRSAIASCQRSILISAIVLRLSCVIRHVRLIPPVTDLELGLALNVAPTI